MRDRTGNPGVGARGFHCSVKHPEECLFDKMTPEDDDEGMSREKKKTGF